MRAGGRVETGRVDDDVECVVGGARLDTCRRDAFDRRGMRIDEHDIVAVISLEITTFERHTLGTECVVGRSE